MRYCYFTFPSTYFALKAEKALNDNLREVNFKMVPVPRSISSSCGTALRADPENSEQVEQLLSQTGVEIEGKYFIEAEEKLDIKKLFGFKKEG